MRGPARQIGFELPASHASTCAVSAAVPVAAAGVHPLNAGCAYVTGPSGGFEAEADYDCASKATPPGFGPPAYAAATASSSPSL